MKPEVTAWSARTGWGATRGEGTACRMTNLFRRDGLASLRLHGEAWAPLGGLPAVSAVTRSAAGAITWLRAGCSEGKAA
jgi:hypothetical protein